MQTWEREVVALLREGLEGREQHQQALASALGVDPALVAAAFEEQHRSGNEKGPPPIGDGPLDS